MAANAYVVSRSSLLVRLTGSQRPNRALFRADVPKETSNFSPGNMHWPAALQVVSCSVIEARHGRCIANIDTKMTFCGIVEGRGG